MPYTTEREWQRQQQTRKGLLALSKIGLGILLGISLAYMFFIGIPS